MLQGTYIPRALRRKLERSSHPLKEDLFLCLLDLTEDQVDELDPSEDWTNLIDSGGLMHINNGTFRQLKPVFRKFFEFFAVCSNNLTLDYNMRKTVHRTNIQKFRRLQCYSGARSGSPQLLSCMT